ncbi:MAG: thioredoxin family protein [Candidatus Saccharimonadales bacterium]
MQGNKLLYIAIAAVIIVITAAFLLLDTNNGSGEDMAPEQTTTNNQQEASEDLNASEQVSTGRYTDYSAEALAAMDDDEVAVVFFKAEWCITCHSLDQDIITNQVDIPEDVTILKADFDTETELKREYDVRMQHTLVQVDSHGNLIKSWFLSPSLEDILNRIERT